MLQVTKRGELHERKRFVYIWLLYSFRNVTTASGLRLPSPLVCAMGSTRLLLQWMLHWGRVSGSAARELLPCTHSSTPSRSLDKCSEVSTRCRFQCFLVEIVNKVENYCWELIVISFGMWLTCKALSPLHNIQSPKSIGL